VEEKCVLSQEKGNIEQVKAMNESAIWKKEKLPKIVSEKNPAGANISL
jgi:hypothetical protein